MAVADCFKWNRKSDGEIARRITRAGLKDLGKKKLLLRAGEDAIFIKGRKVTKKLSSGTHSLKGSSALKDAELIFLDSSEINVPLKLKKFTSKDNLSVKVNCLLALQIKSPKRLFNAGLKDSAAYTRDDAGQQARLECDASLKAEINAYEAGELRDYSEIRDKCIETLRERLKKTFRDSGIALTGFSADWSFPEKKPRSKAKKETPHNAAYWNRRGLKLRSRDSHEKALDAYDRAIALNPKNATYHNNKGLSLEALGRYAEALHAYEKAADLKPEESDYWNNIGLTRRYLKKHKKACDAYRRAIDAEQKNPAYWANLGFSLRALRKHKDAVEAYLKAADLNPKNPAYWSNAGALSQSLGRHNDAVKAYNRAIKLSPEEKDYKERRQVSVDSLKPKKETLPPKEKAPHFDADHWNSKGVSLEKSNKSSEALQAYDKAIGLSPENAAYWQNKAFSFNSLKKPLEAIGSLDKAIEINPREPAYHYNKARILANLKKHNDAIMSYSKAVRLNPKNAQIWSDLGFSLQALGKNKAALEAYGKAADLNPENPMHHNNLGAVRQVLGEEKKAIQAYLRAIDLDPRNPTQWNNLAAALLSLRMPKKAARAYEKALSLEPKNKKYRKGKKQAEKASRSSEDKNPSAKGK